MPYLPTGGPRPGLLETDITALSAPGSRLATKNIADMSVFTDFERFDPLRSGWRQHGLDIDVAEAGVAR